MVADPSGGATSASVSACSGSTSLSLSAGDWVVVTCSSAIIEVIVGTVEVEFHGVGNGRASVSLGEGNELTFKPDTFTIAAAPSQREYCGSDN